MSKLVPKLRFKEFSGEWEEKKLGDYVDILSGESPSKFIFVKDGIPYYKVEQLNDSNKYLEDSVYYIEYSKKIAKKGSLIFPKRGASILLNKIRILCNDSFIDTNLMSLSTKNKLSTEFLYYFILKVDLSKIADTTSIPQINNKHIEPYIVYFPTPKEQQKIADTLSSLDNLIEATSKKVEALKKHKKGLMQKLFPKEGKKEPELRFKEFSGEWEEKTIGNIGKFHYGKSAPKWSLKDDAPTKCVRYGELYTKFGAMITKTYSKTNIDSKKLCFSKGAEILIPRVGERPEEFGKCCSYLPLENIAIGEMISIFETKENPLFYTYYFRNLWIEFSKVVEGQNVKNLYYRELEPLKIYRPVLLEQQKIANTLSSLDSLIEATSKKVEALKKHKKGLMQQMFVSTKER